MVKIYLTQTVQNIEDVLFYVYYSKNETKFFDLINLEQLKELEAMQDQAPTIDPTKETKPPK